MAQVYAIKANQLKAKSDIRQIISQFDLNVDMIIADGTATNFHDVRLQESSYLCYYSISEFALELAKMLRLLKNEKTLLLTNEDMFTKISLIFSRVQKDKLEDGDVQVSDVLDAFNKIKSTTMDHSKENKCMESSMTDEMPQIVANEYICDLKRQNLIDSWALLSKLNAHLETNEKTNNEPTNFIKQANILIVIPENFNDHKLPDSQLAKLLFPEETHKLHIVDLENSNEEYVKKLYMTRWKDVLASLGEKSESQQMKRDESYHIQLFLGYLKILTNSRDELSLAKILCGTGGILKHDAFDILKKESFKTKMPMYQTLVSYVQKMELGAKCNDPSIIHPFTPYIREFCLFVELMNKLNTKIEDEKEAELALRKMLNLIKQAVCKNNTGKVKMSSLDDICEIIMETYSFTTKRFESMQEWIKLRQSNHQLQTPERSVGFGGSIVGKKNMKALKYVIDYFSATQNAPTNIHILLGKIDADKDLTRTPNTSKLSCSISPTSFPTLISLFKTPDVYISEENEDIAEESLSKRLGLDKILGDESQSSMKITGVPQFNANLAWAEETSPIVISPTITQNAQNDCQKPGDIFVLNEQNSKNENTSTPVGRTSNSSKSNIADIILEAREDAEQALKEARQAIKPPKKGSKRSILKDINKVNKYPITATKNSDVSEKESNEPKRIKFSGQENLSLKTASNKGVAKKVQTTRAKKQIIPLKGQMKMTAFLRM